MAEQMVLAMDSKEGITLHTKGVYCDKDIVIVPKFDGGDCTGEHIVDVEKLPETGEVGTTYRINTFVDIIELSNGTLYSWKDQFVAGAVTFHYAKARPANPEASDWVAANIHFYYIEDENAILEYKDGKWVDLCEDNDGVFIGAIADKSQATIEGIYAITKTLYYIYKDGAWIAYSSSPIEISTEAEMTALLETAEIGSIYKYTGESGTYENGALYQVEVGE
jgi:hypothetical protein